MSVVLTGRNPVGRVRSEHGLTLAEAAAEADVNLQAFFLQEQGTYHDLLPAIVRWLRDKSEDVEQAKLDYAAFQTDKRVAWGDHFRLSTYQWAEPGSDHPFVEFRKSLGLSRMAFAKMFCVHASSLHRLEHYQTSQLPHQLVDALVEAGLHEAALGELRYRVGETHVSKR